MTDSHIWTTGDLTPDGVRAQVARIGQGYDPEAQHSDEDGLRELVLMAIRDGHPDPSGLAAAALETGNLDFPRWYA